MADETDRERDEDETEEASDERAEDVEESDAPGKSARDQDDEPAAGEPAGDADEDEAPAPPRKKKRKKAAKSGKRRTGEASAERKRRGPAERAKLPPESEIRAPGRQTLVLLGIMAFSTLAMWGSARFACNAHPAQTRKPREVTTAQLAKDPKDAALELQQRWNSYDFKGALELAKGEIEAELKKGLEGCEKDSSGCEQKKKSVEGKALATAALLSRDAAGAKVRVVSLGGATGEQTIVYELEQDGGMWKVKARTSAPPPPAPTPSGEPAPAPSAAPSAAPEH